MDDAHLIARARSDPSAFRTLYDRHVERIHAYHLRRTGDHDAAHDLTAETFAQAWLCRTRFRDEADGSAAPWLFGIARHVLLASVRRASLERRACERLGILESLDRPAAATEPDERWLDGLDDALAGLTPEQRRALELRIVEDLGYDQVADLLTTSEDVARARVSRGLSALRTTLTDPAETTR
jgi:RNA polymerase sigma-70 factor (ECF subfamily)